VATLLEPISEERCCSFLSLNNRSYSKLV
jgi:hypothetical protein